MPTNLSEVTNNIDLGYKVELPAADSLVHERLLYHGRIGGDLPELENTPMYFYEEGCLSSVFSEHIFLNGDVTCDIAAEAINEQEFNEAYLSHSPVVFPLRVTIDKPIVLDMDQLLEIAKTLGVTEKNRDKFVADFEDSVDCVRTKVFTWAQQQGYNGAIIVNDWTPKEAGGDSCYRTSYVAFAPCQQVRFMFDANAPCLKIPKSEFLADRDPEPTARRMRP